MSIIVNLVALYELPNKVVFRSAFPRIINRLCEMGRAAMPNY